MLKLLNEPSFNKVLSIFKTAKDSFDISGVCFLVVVVGWVGGVGGGNVR